ncbi:hypothetical protein CSA37_11745 [Candidatus Fermentibacteria bacterium]|nr:MAG: hypothetical protein CSA37_11745 [Candidatus Fermentibacteria bacterium]
MLVFFVLAVFAGCQNNTDSMESRLSALQRWMESSSPPAVSMEMPLYMVSEVVLSPESCNYEYFFIESFDIQDGKVFITDGRSSALLAYTLDGELLWKAGGAGEGPGLFSGIGEVAVRGDTLAVCNHGLGRIDLFSSITGEWLSSIPVQWPFDLAYLPDGHILAASIMEPYLLSVLSSEGEVVTSFGQWEAPGGDLLNSMFGTSNRNIHIALLNDSIVAVNSYYFNWMQIYNINTEQLLGCFRRDLPFEEIEVRMENGVFRGKIYTSDIAACNGYIVVKHRPIEENWDLPQMFSSDVPYDELDYSMADVFNCEGDYMGSFAFNRSVGKLLWHDDTLYCATDDTGELIRYETVSAGELLNRN